MAKCGNLFREYIFFSKILKNSIDFSFNIFQAFGKGKGKSRLSLSYMQKMWTLWQKLGKETLQHLTKLHKNRKTEVMVLKHSYLTENTAFKEMAKSGQVKSLELFEDLQAAKLKGNKGKPISSKGFIYYSVHCL